MASAVAGPLERAFATIPGINLMTSSSALGVTQIVMQFDLDRNIDGAALDVQSNISATLRKLPQTLPAPPSFQKINPADSPILFIALESNTLPLSRVNDYAEEVFAEQISQIAGVSQVLVFGEQKFAVRVAVDPDAAAARGLTLDNVGTAVAAANSSTPVGALLGTRQNVTVDATGQLLHADAYKNLVVAWRNGSPVRLDQIAHAYDSVENKQIAAWHGDQRAIVLAVFRQSDANTVSVVDGVKAKIPYYESQLPPSIKAEVLNDRSLSIRQSIEDVQYTLLVSIVLVIIVIFVFLKSAAATLIPALALPVSLIGACAFMYGFGYSIDNISLLAITLSVGFVVDDAIVMLENITRHIEAGMKPFDAALKGSGEIAFTILSITFSLVAVFIPVLLMSGVVGRVFREFAVTITVAILVSGFVSLTLTPMLCARILSAPKHGAQAGWFSRASDLFVDSLAGFYRVTLGWVLRVRFLMLLVTFGTAWLALSLYINVPKGFFPDEDTGFLRGITEAQADTSFTEMSRRQQIVVSILQKDPAIESVTSAVGFGGATNKGFLFLKLKPKRERGPVFAVMGRLRAATSIIPGIRTLMMPVQNLEFTGGRIARAKYQYTLQSGDQDSLFKNAPIMEREMAKLPGLRDVNSDLQISNPETSVDIDRDKAAAFGVSVDAIRNALYSAFGVKQISTIFTPADDYQVILEASDTFQNEPGALGRLRIATPSGALLPLDEVATLKRSVGPLQINRQAQQPAVTISFNLAPDTSLGQAIEAIHALEGRIQPARRHPHQLRRQRAAVPAGAGRPGRAAARRGADDLHPARRALRELHPPDHDPLGPAVGRHRRAAGAAMAAHGPQRDRHHRHPAADRHRQEERDHDGRFRADASARGRRRGDGDPRGGAGAVPADHHDDAGGAARHAADRLRHRRGRRTAPAPRHRHRRRPLRQPGADALHHAGRLHLSRQGRFLARRPANRAEAKSRDRGGRARRSRGMNIQKAACRNMSTTMTAPAENAALRGGCRSAR